MLNKKFSVIVGILIVIGLTFYITPIRGITRDGTVSTVAEKDSYVSISNFKLWWKRLVNIWRLYSWME